MSKRIVRNVICAVLIVLSLYIGLIPTSELLIHTTNGEQVEFRTEGYIPHLCWWSIVNK